MSGGFEAFAGKGFSMAKRAVYFTALNDEDITYDTPSRIEPKRVHQWSLDGTEAELFPNKKQAIEIPSHGSISGVPNAHISMWGNPSIPQAVSTHLGDPLLRSDTLKIDSGSPQMGISMAEPIPLSPPKKKKEPKVSKNVLLNNFPTNVKSFLSTGLLEGVSVKYISGSGKKELRGIIKDSGYLCGCPMCNFTKVLNAHEFERHAGCLTKHPNSHIYLDNGKAIYSIVQELRSTPINLLDEVIRSVIGTPINEKRYRIWRESFKVASRKILEINGETTPQSQPVSFIEM
eukprot:TRINITY_DN6155_c0_g1_i1.p1 TRINITY_DN6155_c0_g1~~TRINITY_DN6155_c0_g1_i1.p1  ORF type:complete len:289 (+),score=48.95 TRINITY_DN6155_c0_g1_i1:219-1085(+)